MSAATFIYFLRPIGMVGPIKIGCSKTPYHRLATIMAWSPFPLEIVAKIPGDAALEQNIHECLLDAHSHGEWFLPTPAVLDLVEAVRQGKPIAEGLDLSRRGGSIRQKRKYNHSPSRKLIMSYRTRLRFALSRAQKDKSDNQLFLPRDVSAFLALAVFERRAPTSAEIERLEAVLADPGAHCKTYFDHFDCAYLRPRPSPERMAA